VKSKKTILLPQKALEEIILHPLKMTVATTSPTMTTKMQSFGIPTKTYLVYPTIPS
jgi:hypothetical protein